MTISTSRRAMLAGSAAIAVIMSAGEASAAGSASSAPTTLDELVVTANKREEKLKDVAVAVSAVTQEHLERTQAINFQDYAKLIPGLSLSEAKPGQTVLALRGLSSLSAGSTVGIYVDDTPYGSSSGLTNGQFYTGDLNTFDMQRVEVLKGPQGTLYGASTLGGLLKFVTNRPDPKAFGAEVVGGLTGTHGAVGWSAKGMVNVPLGADAAVRIAVTHNEIPGFIDDPARHRSDTNDAHQTSARLSFLYQPTDKLTLRLSAVGQDGVFHDSNAIDARTDAIGRVLIPLQPVTGDLQLSHGVSEFAHVKYRVFNGNVDWNLGWATLTSVTSYSQLRESQLTDDTSLGSVEAVGRAIQNKATEEVRLASNASEHLEWIAGVYVTRETSKLGNNYLGVYTGVGDLSGNSSNVNSTFEEAAAFGTLTYHFTPQFDVAVGGRFAHNRQRTDQFGVGAGPAGFLFASPSVIGHSSEDVFLYSIAPRWRPSDDVTVYGRLASGYRPGGPNVTPFGSPAGTVKSFDADKVTSGELGLRTDLLDHTLSLDLSAFYVRWRDIQLLGTVTIGGVSTGVTQNGGSAESRGFEWAGVWRPLAGLTLGWNGAYTDASLTADTTPEVGGKDGDPLPFVPKWTSTLDGEYAWTLAGAVRAFVGATWAYVGSRHTDLNPPGPFQQIRLQSYQTVDLRAGLERDRWTLEVFAKNIGDKRGITGVGTNAGAPAAAASPTLGFGATAAIIRPRTIGVSLTGRF